MLIVCNGLRRGTLIWFLEETGNWKMNMFILCNCKRVVTLILYPKKISRKMKMDIVCNCILVVTLICFREKN